MPAVKPVSQINSALTEEMLCQQREGQYLERKGRDTRPVKIARELIGMLNAGGGTLVYGIADDGVIENLEATDLGLKVSAPDLDLYRTLVHEFIHPPARIELEEVYLSDGALVFLYHVDQDYERLFQLKDTEEVFLRVADKNLRQNREQVKALEYNKQIRKFEDESRVDFDPVDFSQATCAVYLGKMNYKGSFQELALKRALAIKKDGQVVYKNCAILLFADDPEKYIPNASVRYVRYAGTEQKSGKEYNVVKDQRFEGNIPRLIEIVDHFIEASLRDYYYLDLEKGVFRRIPEFPRDSWLEGIVNALCHRSYHVQGNPILIKHFDDRLEISNSGPLPAQVTVENIKDVRFARNSRIARVLSDLGYVRELNEGVPRIFGAMAELSLSIPEYKDHENTVTLTLRNKVTDHHETIIEHTFERIQDEWAGLNTTQQAVIAFLFEEQEATVGGIAESIGVGEKAVRNNLKKLISLKIAERVSDKIRDPDAIYRFKHG
ncbi:MAG: ATP-binding protein [Akkermansiaceae bacterium]